jgi:hypothetical protein
VEWFWPGHPKQKDIKRNSSKAGLPPHEGGSIFLRRTRVLRTRRETMTKIFFAAVILAAVLAGGQVAARPDKVATAAGGIAAHSELRAPDGLRQKHA